MESARGKPGSTPAAVVGLAASAGGLSALSQILGALPAAFPCPILLVMHLDPHHRSLLSEILANRTKLKVVTADEGAVLRPGTVYVAPPGRHLEVDDAYRVRLTLAPLVHYARPSADVLFASLAQVYGPAAVGVICSGSGKDGAAGLLAIRQAGGVTMAQDPETSEFNGMPGEAVRLGAAGHVLPLSRIAPRLLTLVAT